MPLIMLVQCSENTWLHAFFFIPKLVISIHLFLSASNSWRDFFLSYQKANDENMCTFKTTTTKSSFAN